MQTGGVGGRTADALISSRPALIQAQVTSLIVGGASLNVKLIEEIISKNIVKKAKSLT